MEWNFVIKKIVKQNDLYYSVFIDRWRGCRCSAIYDAVVLMSEYQLTPATPGIRDRIQAKLQIKNH